MVSDMRPQSSIRSRFIAVVFAGFALGAVACGPSRTAAEAQADLAASEPAVRLKASRDIEAEAKTRGALAPNVLDDVLAKVATETDPKVKGSMVITLGYTGDARAKPIIDAYVQTTDYDQQRWAARALKWYQIKTGKVAADYVFPPHWPYGTAGYPAVAEK